MPTPGPAKRSPLMKNSPFEKLAPRAVETGNDALKEARQIAIDRIDTNPRQPRRTFNETSLSELAADIRQRGILQPPIVRPVEGGRYEIVVGERRYRAAKQAGLESIPVLVRDLSDQEAEITSLIENIQRENLNLSDEVNYFQMLKTKYDYSIREIADEVAHKSHGYVEVRLKLAEHPEVLRLVESQKLGLQQANMLMRLGAAALQTELAKVKTSSEKSQSVFSKDTKLEKSQSKPAEPKPAGVKTAARLAKLITAFSWEIEKVTAHFEKGKPADKQIIIDSIENLENDLADLKRRLKGR